MTNEELNQRQQQTELSTNNDAIDASERPRHDELFKKVMSELVAAREFLGHYLPVTFKSKININSVKIEKESFVTEDLRKRLSDVVYSVFLKKSNIKDNTDEKSVHNDKAYVYLLIEQVRHEVAQLKSVEIQLGCI